MDVRETPRSSLAHTPLPVARPTRQPPTDDRLLARIRDSQWRLGGDPAHLSPWHAPEKPKGMHTRTYWRLVDEMDDCERRRIGALAAGFNRLMARSDRLLSRSRSP